MLVGQWVAMLVPGQWFCEKTLGSTLPESGNTQETYSLGAMQIQVREGPGKNLGFPWSQPTPPRYPLRVEPPLEIAKPGYDEGGDGKTMWLTLIS